MLRCEAKPYKGDEPFIFVSYSHKDVGLAAPIIEHLVSGGYRIWYDEGIDPGTEWVTNIAEHLSRSSAVIAFLSPNFIKSHNCREEIIFARDANIPVLGIYLTETQLDSGLKLALTSYQMICFYTYEKVEPFYAWVEQSSVLLGCRDEPAELQQAAAVEIAVSNKEAEACVVVSDTDAKQLPHPRSVTPRHSATSRPKRHMSRTTKRIVVGSACGALAIAAAIFIGTSSVLSPNNDVADNSSSQTADQGNASEESSESSSLHYPSCKDAGLDQDTVRDDASFVTPEDEALAMLDDPDSYRGETLCSYAYVDTYAGDFHLTGSASDVLGKDHTCLELLPSGENICIPSSETKNGLSIDDDSYFMVQGTLDTISGDAYLHDVSVTSVGYFEAVLPALARWDNLGSQEKSGIAVSVDAVCFSKNETRVWYTVSNSRSTSVLFDVPSVKQNNEAVGSPSVSTQGQMLSSSDTVSVTNDKSLSGYVAYAPLDEGSFAITIGGFNDEKLSDLTFEFEINPPS